MKHSRTKLGRDQAALEARRLEAARLFGAGVTQAQVARHFGVSTSAVNHWHHAWKAAGEAGLRSAGKTGPNPRLSVEQRAHLEALLVAGPQAAGYRTDLWTLGRIQELIQRHFRVHYHQSHVWLLLQQLGWSCQRPTTRAKERDEEAICRWLKVEWPRLKRGRRERALRSSL